MDDKAFVGLYPVSKTLRFSLIPKGKTLEHIIRDGILEQDEHRAESYEKVKRLIDEYHKVYIENTLRDFELKYENEGNLDSLEEYYTSYMMGNRTEEQKKQFERIQSELRKQIANRLTKNETYKRIDKKELIKDDLMQFVKTIEDKQMVSEFQNFTTYFTGFHENRKNMYSADAQSTAIAYRLIHENLPKFIDNMQVFDKFAATELSMKLQILYADFESYLNVGSIDEMFRLDYYNVLLTQPQIDVYNAVIGGKVLDDGRKIQGLNEYINLYNQQQKDKHDRLPKFKPLFKQILSDRNVISWLPENFETDEEVLEAIEQCYLELEQNILTGEHSLRQLLIGLRDYDLKKVYVCNDMQLTDISQRISGSWSAIQRVLDEDFDKSHPKEKRETAEGYEERKRKYFKNMDSFSIAEIDEKLAAAGMENECRIADYFIQMKGHLAKDEGIPDNLFDRIELFHEEVKDLLNTPYPKDKNLVQDKRSVECIKQFLDAIKDLQHFVKPLLGSGDEADKEERFYGEFTPLWEELDKITLLYNKVRNYMTRKPYSVEKIKLNFENSTLMAGWDVNKEHDNTTVILRKDGLYYLGIMNKYYNRAFDEENIPESGDCYEKMVYKLLPGANKMLPKVFFSKTRMGEFSPSQKILEIREKGSFKKGDNFNMEDCHALIDFFKTSIGKHKDWRNFNFHFSPAQLQISVAYFCSIGLYFLV